MKKIILITPILQHYRLTFYEKLSKAGADYELQVFYGYKLRDDGRPGYDGKTKFFSRGFREYKFNIYPFKIVYNKGMVKAVKEADPDIVILQGIAGDITNRRVVSWARRKKKKIIIWACGWEPGKAKGLLLSFKNFLVSTFFRKADYFLTYSTKASKYVINMGISESVVETCYNGIETDVLDEKRDSIINESLQIRKRFLLEGYISFLYVGGLIHEKKVDLLIEAFLKLKRLYTNIKLLIIGDGPLREKVEEMLKKADDENIFYLGRIIENVDPYFAASDCFVLPGVGGLALNQAMYWGKPCIVSEADGTEDDLVIDGISGYRFKKNNLESLISAMERRINESPERLQTMSEKAREIIVKRSNVNNMVSHFVNAIEKVGGGITQENDVK